MKKMLISAIGVLILLTGCSTASTSNEKYNHSQEPSPGLGIVAVKVSINYKENNTSVKFFLKNQTESPQTYTYASSKIFSYKVYDKDGKLIIDSNEGKMFTLALKDVTIKQGEELELGTVSFEGFESGTYTIEATSEPMESKPFKLKTEFTIQ